MADQTRIAELEGRLQREPASIAFAQLGEEYRRAGRLKDAIAACRAGLGRHPGYLSARVTLGRALLELGDLDAAHRELDEVRRIAPENLAAIRGLAEIHRRRGELPEALEQYRTAFELAQNDPGIDQIVKDLRRQIEPQPGRRPTPQAGRTAPRRATPPDEAVVTPAPARAATVPAAASPGVAAPRPAPPPPATRPRTDPVSSDPQVVRVTRVVLLLERWLEGIVADRRVRIYGAQA